MPMIASQKNLRKMLEPFLREGESLGGLTFQGGFKKCAIASTDMGRIIITTLPFFGSKAKMLREIPFAAVDAVDIYPSGTAAFLVISSGGERVRYKVPVGLFDTFGEAARIYHDICLNNPGAAPSYIPDGETVDFMLKTDRGVIKLCSTVLLLLTTDKAGLSLELQEKVPFSSIVEADCYPGKMTASFLWLRDKQGETLFKIGDIIIGFGSAFEAVMGKGSLIMAERLLQLILEKNSSAAPAYLLPGEKVLHTARVGHSRMTIIGGSFLRATERRLLELEAGSNGALLLKHALDFSEIESCKLTEIRSDNSVNYELLVYAKGEKHKFVADSDYSDAMRAMLELVNKR
jgi:hypothetical protein